MGQRQRSPFSWFLRKEEGEEEEERVQASLFDPQSSAGRNSSSQE